jgi:uracil phosphoribosyltransferase
MRDQRTPTATFRQLLREIAMLLCYEATRDLPVERRTVHTPVAPAEVEHLEGKKLVLASILRAGNGLLEGMLDLVPSARVAHVGLYRDPETLRPVEYYFKAPDDLAGRRVIVVDPMLATGHSAVAAVDLLKTRGALDVRFVCLLAAPEGVQTLQQAHPDLQIVTAAIDEGLNEHGYIVPGLGDAGDRMYGTK